MVCEFWKYQVLQLQSRSDEEKANYLKMLVQNKLKEFANAIKSRTDEIQYDYASLEICRKDEVGKIIDEEMKIRTDLLMGSSSRSSKSEDVE